MPTKKAKTIFQTNPTAPKPCKWMWSVGGGSRVAAAEQSKEVSIMAEVKERECPGCGIVKDLLDDFGKHPGCKDGHLPTCKDCKKEVNMKNAKARAVRKLKRETASKEISEENKRFYRLGYMEGAKHCRDLEKTINIQMRANLRLFEVIREKDNRDAKRLFIPLTL